MQAVRFSRFGKAHEVAELVDLDEPAAPAAGEVLVQVMAASIDPASLLMFEGRYGAAPPPLPVFAGNQAVGRVIEAGAGVAHLGRGDKVLLGDGSHPSWRERMTLPAAGLFPVADADPLQLAMLRSTAGTPFAMLRMAPLSPGDWVIQNAANSGVGLVLIGLARSFGLRTVNVVRRPGLEDALRARGADAVLLDGPDLAERVAAITGGDLPRLGIDAVAGEASGRMASALAEGGLLVTYGLLSGAPCAVPAGEIIFRRIEHRGFWRSHWAAVTPPAEVVETYRELSRLLAAGAFAIPVEAVYPLAEMRRALAHAARPGRHGKILLLTESAG